MTLFSLLTMKSTFLFTSLVLATSSFALPQPQTQPQTPVTTPESLDRKFKSLGKKYFGTCTDKPLLVKGANAVIIAKDFGQVTPENSYVPFAHSEPPIHFLLWCFVDYEYIVCELMTCELVE